MYYLGDQDANTFYVNLRAGADPLAKEVIRQGAIQYTKEGTWDLTQWKCQPAV